MSRASLIGTSLLSLALLLGSTVLTLADGEVVKENIASEVSIAPTPDGHYETTTVNRRFETDVFDTSAGKDSYKLLEIEQTHVFADGPDTDADMKTAKVKVTVYPITKRGKGAADYTIEAKGDEVKVDGPYLTVVTWGCCAEQETYGVYSVETGAYLFNATGEGESGDWITMNAKGNAAERIIAYHLAPTDADDVVLKGAPNAVIAISYATPTKPLQRILVTIPQAMMDNNGPLDWDPKFELIDKIDPKDTTHMYVDRAGDPATLFTDATVRLSLGPKMKIEIPLTGDKLKVAAARLPKGFALVEVQP